MKRCHWVDLNSPIYVKYHDEEWGIPVHDDQKLFELLVLESFQAGLSWLCILNKRESFRESFDNFSVEKVSEYDDEKIQKLLLNKNIIRNKNKIISTINNAKIFLEIKKEWGTFDNYIWHFTDGQIIKNNSKFLTTSPLSDEISNDLRKRGMKYTGSTIIYSYLQAIGIINDHELECYKFKN